MPKVPQACSHSWEGWKGKPGTLGVLARDRAVLETGCGVERARRWQWVTGREGRPDEKQVTRRDVETGEI